MTEKQMTPAEEIEKLSEQVKKQRAGHKKTNRELKQEKARYSVLASEYSLVLEELKTLKGSKPLMVIDDMKREVGYLKSQLKCSKEGRKTDGANYEYLEAEMKHEIETLQARVENLNHTVLQQNMQNREIKKTVLKSPIPEEFHNLLEELSGDSSYE